MPCPLITCRFTREDSRGASRLATSNVLAKPMGVARRSGEGTPVYEHATYEHAATIKFTVG